MRFFAPPERLLACVSAGEPLPALTEKSLPILFAPGLAEVCRPATEEETSFWESLQAPASAAALMQEGHPRSLISSMLDIGAIDLSSPDRRLRSRGGSRWAPRRAQPA